MKKAKLLPLTYYEMMGLDRGCSTHDINNQFERLKRIYYPENPMLRDLFDDEGLYIFNNLLDHIHKHLADFELRKEYDMEVDSRINSLEESFPEEFSITDILRKYSKTKKDTAKPKLIKKDIYGRDAEKKPVETEVNDAPDTNAIFNKFSEEPISGEQLKAIREEIGLTLKSITSSTKISSFVITSIESDSYSSLPAEIYVKGFLKTYCKALGLNRDNTDRVIKDFIRLMKAVISPVVEEENAEEK
jgi:hypothetical protein